MKIIKNIAFVGLILVGNAGAVSAAEVTVKKGDTLWDLGETYNVPYQSIMAANNLNSDLILIGQKLTIPDGSNNQGIEQKPVRFGYSQSEIDLLASLVRAEAGGEPMNGKIAVAAVVLNRVESNNFPDSIREVIYQQGQFSPVMNGSINVRGDSGSYAAVYAALKGQDPTNGALYFYNPGVVYDYWNNSRPATAIIGNHRFTM